MWNFFILFILEISGLTFSSRILTFDIGENWSQRILIWDKILKFFVEFFLDLLKVPQKTAETQIIVDNFFVFEFILPLKLSLELLQEIITDELLILLAVEVNVELDQTLRNSAHLKVLLAQERECFLLDLFPEITFLSQNIANLSIMDNWFCQTRILIQNLRENRWQNCVVVDRGQRGTNKNRLEGLSGHFMALLECLDQVTANLMERELIKRTTLV